MVWGPGLIAYVRFAAGDVLHRELKDGDSGWDVGEGEAGRGFPLVAVAVASLQGDGSKRAFLAFVALEGIDEH